jgi:hypothetical protein
LGRSQRNPSAASKVPGVFGGIHSADDGSRDLDFNGDTFASGASDSVRRIDFISVGAKHASPDSQIWSVENDQEERNMLKDSKAFSGFSTVKTPPIVSPR